MEITLLGTTIRDAERACRMVFGEDANQGPLIAAPDALLAFKDAWPGHKDEVLTLSLELPMDFDIEHFMAKDNRKAVVLRCHRLTILHQGKAVGFALRTDALGINALELHRDTWAQYNNRVRQAH